MDLVEDRLWISGLDSALNTDLLSKNEIIYIVTVDIKPIPSVDRFNYFFIRAQDVPSEDLLSYFEEAVNYINASMKNGSVLVHCHHGVSRSATIIMSYLMRTHNISVDEALKRLQSVRPAVQPNVGFMRQLKVYQHLIESNLFNSSVMRWCQLESTTHRVVKRWISPDEVNLVQNTESSHLPLLKCKKCRQVVAHDSDLIDHFPGQSPDAGDENWIKLIKNRETGEVSCKEAFFVFPTTWMQFETSLEGKLNCPKCHAKIGAFAWTRKIQCPCSANFQPGIYLQASRVDMVKYSYKH